DRRVGAHGIVGADDAAAAQHAVQLGPRHRVPCSLARPFGLAGSPCSRGPDALLRSLADEGESFGIRSSTRRHTAAGSIGVPGGGFCETTNPSPDSRAVSPSFTS